MGDTLEAALQALITALFFALAAGGLAWFAQYPQPLQVALIVGSLAGLIGWLAFRDRVSRLGDYVRGYVPPAQATQTEAATVIRVVAENNLAGDILRFGLPPEKLRALAAGLAAGEPFTQVRWEELLTRPGVVEIQNEFVKFGYARLRTPGVPARGYELTAQGRAVVKYLANPL